MYFIIESRHEKTCYLYMRNKDADSLKTGFCVKQLICVLKCYFIDNFSNTIIDIFNKCFFESHHEKTCLQGF